MKLLDLSLLGAFAASALAADCLAPGAGDLTQFQDPFWDARYKVCHNEPGTGCGWQQNCQYTSVEDRDIAGKVYVRLTRKNWDGHKGFKDCWAATEQMINQCVKTKKGSWASTWNYAGQFYQFDFWQS
ncbi:hypothetical protein VFPFJ_09679 [Purpureocillium lilacinum]|nr:hypothetical protein VFPFJ_09679 [Purpureocillium lilacinum]OAQ75598.1 hypothetical protein VFPBJ_09571 [Purpureocillium lilacinum]OAQ81224.1 hypothetical protein VFPFJ_09679 [Purpureocillium lilacinum]GJN69990.1 hypothetical protein PLICBS_004042 [Purpureocillium lilacinum]